MTLEDALELFKLPRNLGDFEGKDMTVGTGRFGPYIRHNSSFYSLPKIDDPLLVDADRAMEIILAKRKADAEKVIMRFTDTEPEIQVLNGRFGPYITQGKENFKIPKDRDPKTLSLADCVAIIADEANKPKKIKRGKK